MPALLIPLTLFFIFACFASYKNNVGKTDIRLSFIYALISISFFVAVSTELLSAFNAITKSSLVILWICISAATGFWWFRRKKYIPSLHFVANRFTRIILSSVFIILCITCITAIASYPNNWDSMTYHLARVMHWIQNKNVAHYPTQIDRQITQPPFSEYFFLHIKLLSGYDPLLNLVQWIFFAGSIAAVSLITQETGGNNFQQSLSAFFCATIPMAILQSNSTQNDLVTGGFIAFSILFLIRCYRYNFNPENTIAFYCSAALALLTKGTSLIYLLPVTIIFGLSFLFHRKWKALPGFVTGILIVALVIAPFWIRNNAVYDSPLGRNYDLNNAAYGIVPMLSNASKNIAMHLRTPVPSINNTITNITAGFNDLIGINIHSPKYNWDPSPPFEVGFFSTQEDSAGNFFHVLLLMTGTVLLFFRKSLRSNVLFVLIFIITALMFLTFCFVLKWQVWHTRLQLPVFIISAVLLAEVVNTFSDRIKKFIFILFIFFSGIFLFFNQSRPWCMKENIFNSSPEIQYFKNNPELLTPFCEMSAVIENVHAQKIGYISSGDSWEYPFGVLNKHIDKFELQNLLPENPSAALSEKPAFKHYVPDLLIVNRFAPDASGNYNYHENNYSLCYQNGIWAVYKRNIKFP